MSTIVEAAQALIDACKTVEGVEVYTDPGASVNPPAVLVEPPSLTWEAYSTSAPTTATFTLYLLVRSDGYALSNLEPLVLGVTDALWDVQNAVVTGAVPSNLPVGGANLPAYILTCEVSL